MDMTAFTLCEVNQVANSCFRDTNQKGTLLKALKGHQIGIHLSIFGNKKLKIMARTRVHL